MKLAMWRLRSIPITTVNMYLFYNMYLMTHVYFGCGIMNITPPQETVLMKLSETFLLQKLKLSVKMPREVLYTRKSALGVGLMKPSTIIAVLALQSYFGHMRMEGVTAQMVNILEENKVVQYGYMSNIMEILREYKIEQTTWCDEIAQMTNERNLEVLNRDCQSMLETSNKSIMEYVMVYIQEMNNSTKVVPPINHIRLYKRIYLLCELVRMSGRIKTYEFIKDEEKSFLRWKMEFPKVLKSSKKIRTIWKEFIEWLAGKQINIINDFDHQLKCQYQLSEDGEYLKINDEEIKYFSRE